MELTKKYLINGPNNIIRLSDGHKILYIFSDFHHPTNYQTECPILDNYDSIDIDKILFKFMKLEKEREFDLFIEMFDHLDPSYNTLKKERYIDNVNKLFNSRIHFKDKKIYTLKPYSNFRFHYFDIRNILFLTNELLRNSYNNECICYSTHAEMDVLYKLLKTYKIQPFKDFIDFPTLDPNNKWLASLLFSERNLDSNIIHSLETTKETKVQNLGYIAKLNLDKTQILNIYLDRKTAAHQNGFESSSALDNPVKNGTIVNNQYYTLYDKCEADLINNFEEEYGKPLLYKNGVGQYDLDNNLINEFACKYDCTRELKMSDKTLAKALDKNIQYNGFYYKSLGIKIFI